MPDEAFYLRLLFSILIGWSGLQVTRSVKVRCVVACSVQFSGCTKTYESKTWSRGKGEEWVWKHIGLYIVLCWLASKYSSEPRVRGQRGGSKSPSQSPLCPRETWQTCLPQALTSSRPSYEAIPWFFEKFVESKIKRLVLFWYKKDLEIHCSFLIICFSVAFWKVLSYAWISVFGGIKINIF